MIAVPALGKVWIAWTIQAHSSRIGGEWDPGVWWVRRTRHGRSVRPRRASTWWRSERLGALNTRIDNTGPCLDELVFVEQAGDRLRRALNEMPQRARQAFLLHRLEGLSHDKIARQLGVTTRIVENDVAQVVQHLTRVLFASEGS